MKKKRNVSTIRLVVDKDYFNKLVSLTDCEDNDYDNEIETSNLYDKLMKFTFVNDNENVELRLFPFEASQVILLLLCNIDKVEIKKDYYKELIQTKKQRKE